MSLTQTISELKVGMIEIGQKNTQQGEQNAESLKDIEMHLES